MELVLNPLAGVGKARRSAVLALVGALGDAFQ
jgi:hypothetical protein